MTLSQFLVRPEPLRPLPPPPSDARMRQSIQDILVRWPELDDGAKTDPESVLREMAGRIEKWDWDGADLRFMGEVAGAAFDARFVDHAEFAPVRAFLLAELAAGAPDRLRASLFGAYVAHFRAQDVEIARLAAGLSKAALPSRQAAILREVPEFLDLAKAPSAVADRMAAADDAYAEIQAIGLAVPQAPGLMDAAHLAYVERLAPQIERWDIAARLLQWLRPKGQGARLVGAEAAIDALLSPWLQKDPIDTEGRMLVRALVDMYGDPRVMNGAPWHGVGVAQRRAFERMLMGENLRLLFDAVSRTVSDATHERMWKERRRFYLGLHAQKRIDAAWVAFDRAGAQEARRMLAGQGEGTLRFGRQVAGGTRSTTSILILRIGPFTVVDGSHNYKVHVFEGGYKQKPELYQQAYDCERIRLMHPTHWSKAHQGNWKGELELKLLGR